MKEAANIEQKLTDGISEKNFKLLERVMSWYSQLCLSFYIRKESGYSL